MADDDDRFPGLPSQVRHGTYSGYITHIQRGIPVCERCTEARRAYDRERHNNPEHVQRTRLRSAAQNAALLELARRHRDEYRDIYRQECHDRGLTTREPR